MKASGLHLASVREACQCIESLWRDMRGVMSDLSLCVALCASACVCMPLVFVRVVGGRLLIRAFELTGLCVWPTRCTKCVVQRLSLQVQELRAEEERDGRVGD